MRSSENILRIVTALIGIPVVIGAMWAGGGWFWLLIAAISLGGQYELYHMARRRGYQPALMIGWALGIVVLLRWLDFPWYPVLLGGILVLIAYELIRSSATPMANVGIGLLGLVYPVWMISLLVDIRLMSSLPDPEAFYLTLLLFVLIWATDTAAYYVGRTWGRHRLAPHISPGKTWEGAVGGVAGALLTAGLLKYYFIHFLSLENMMVLALIASILGPVGDLVESRFKRAVGVKDSGKLLPGHGGLLDRFDALLFAVPADYIYLKYFVGILG